MSVVLRWNFARGVRLRWRGQGFEPPVTTSQATALAAVIGPAGKSAYQSWLDQGNVGTEAEFLASLSTGGLTAGPGFRIVGSELRHHISSLTRG